MIAWSNQAAAVPPSPCDNTVTPSVNHMSLKWTLTVSGCSRCLRGNVHLSSCSIMCSFCKNKSEQCVHIFMFSKQTFIFSQNTLWNWQNYQIWIYECQKLFLLKQKCDSVFLNHFIFCDWCVINSVQGHLSIFIQHRVVQRFVNPFMPHKLQNIYIIFILIFWICDDNAVDIFLSKVCNCVRRGGDTVDCGGLIVCCS